MVSLSDEGKCVVSKMLLFSLKSAEVVISGTKSAARWLLFKSKLWPKPNLFFGSGDCVGIDGGSEGGDADF